MRNLVAALAFAAACFGGGRAYIVDQPPPEPQFERVEYQPGQVWVKGYWAWDGGQWRWERGHWESERMGYVWRDGYWEPRGNRWYWVDGHWEAGNVEVREHH